MQRRQLDWKMLGGAVRVRQPGTVLVLVLPICVTLEVSVKPHGVQYYNI